MTYRILYQALRSPYQFYNIFRYKFIDNKIIRNFDEFCEKKIGHALLYYVGRPFIFKKNMDNYTHTNQWEVVEIAKILNELGFWVDIVDRDVDIDKFHPEDKYDIFIGIGSGNSGRHYPEIASQVQSATKIFYATGMNPDIRNKYVLKRHDLFSKRNNGIKLKLRRIADKVDMESAMRHTDAIFSTGNQTTMETYARYKKPMFRIYPSTSPKIRFDTTNLKEGDKKKFLYFGGNGNLVKGLDLVIEAFSELPDLNLYICAPEEDDFFEHYSDLISKSKNIHFLGFIKVAGKKFNDITSKSGYVILPSASEAPGTSVTTCMRRGLIPIVTRECGLDVGDFGFLIEDIEIDALKKQILEISEMPDRDFKERSTKTYMESFKYTQQSFSDSFRAALLNLIKI
jgi:glycosyltransferase involved in cell wall biosynthesis